VVVAVAPPTLLLPRVCGAPTSTPGPTLFKCGRVFHTWPSLGEVGVQQPHLRPQAMLAGALRYGPPKQVGPPFMPPLASLPIHRGQQQALAPLAPAAGTLGTGSWDQQLLANSFNTVALIPPAVTDWVTDSGASNHTTLDVGNLTSIHPPHTNDPSSIIVGNISSLPVTLVGDTTLPGPFYFNNVLVTHNIIQNLLYVHCLTTDN
jgi:hypothetical protein